MREKVRGAVEMTPEDKEQQVYFNKLYTTLQASYDNEHLKEVWTVSLKRDAPKRQTKTNFRPAAFQQTFNTVQDIMKLFGIRFIA